MAVVKLENGELRDQIREAVYDSYIADGPTPGLQGQINFFTSLQNPNGTPKSLARTNLEQAGQFTAYNSFRVQGVSMDVQNFDDTILDAIPAIQRNASIQFVIGTKVYYKGPMTFVMGRIHEFSSGINRVSQRAGEVAVQGVVLEGKHSVDIEPLYTFRVVYELLASDCNAADTAALSYAAGRLILVASLKGLRRRPVQ